MGRKIIRLAIICSLVAVLAAGAWWGWRGWRSQPTAESDLAGATSAPPAVGAVPLRLSSQAALI